VAREHGVNTFVRFFGLEAGKDIAKEHGRATALLAANVMCHIADLHDIAKGADALLTADGVLIFEDPYLGAMLEQTSYDQIYDEHVHIFSALSVGNMFSRYGFELIDVLKQGTHGGSMRYVFARKGNRPVSHSVARTIKEEMNSGLHLPETYKKFRVECEASRERLLRRLKLEREAGRRVVGYGATSKSTTILNYCSIGPELVEFISDTTPLKQGKYSPGMHIPIKAYTAFCQSPPDTALLFAWNHRSEIMEKERRFGEGGGKWLTHIDKD
jgi:methylation protein EvaC